jgi:hypothetical protein
VLHDQEKSAEELEQPPPSFAPFLRLHLLASAILGWSQNLCKCINTLLDWAPRHPFFLSHHAGIDSFLHWLTQRFLSLGRWHRNNQKPKKKHSENIQATAIAHCTEERAKKSTHTICSMSHVEKVKNIIRFAVVFQCPFKCKLRSCCKPNKSSILDAEK